MLRKNQDAFGEEIFAYLTEGNGIEIVERSDGWIGPSSGPQIYFANFEDWPTHQQEAMSYIQGRVLDIGCGAGRVCLYLQSKGFYVLGVDNSPLALDVCRLRGVNNTSLTPITQISSKLGIFDSIIMLGNNFGLFGNPRRAKFLLRRFYRMTSNHARIIAESNDIYKTEDVTHLAYHEMNRKRGRMAGQIRLRVRFKNIATPWFDYLMVSKEEMADIIKGTGWSVTCFIDTQERPTYIAIIEKE